MYNTENILVESTTSTPLPSSSRFPPHRWGVCHLSIT